VLEGGLDFLFGFEKERVVLFFDDDEVGFEAAVWLRVSVGLIGVGMLRTSNDLGV
jgi:hypothetical protein